ncbi:MAG: hypothetical protein LBS74_04745 [Oscillospiraceae bacterium]|nr:hypothetical protein [Oscillospiraceae bacterium]
MLIQILVTAISVAMLLVLIIIGIKAKGDEGANVIRNTKVVYWLGVVCTFAICAMAILLAFAGEDYERIFAIPLLLFSVVGIFLCVMHFNYKIEIDGEYLNYRNQFGIKYRFPIKDVYIDRYVYGGTRLACGKRRIPIVNSDKTKKLIELVENNECPFPRNIVKFSIWYKLFFLVMSALSIWFVSWFFLTQMQGFGLYDIIVYAMVALVVLNVLCLSIRSINLKIELREHTIIYRTAFANEYEIPYEEIEIKRVINGNFVFKYGQKRFYALTEAKNFQVFYIKLAKVKEEQEKKREAISDG